VSPDRIDHRGLLANKQMPCAVKHQAALLLPAIEEGVVIDEKGVRSLARKSYAVASKSRVCGFPPFYVNQDSGRTFRAVCPTDEDLPPKSTVHDYLEL
jgi:hypothetical protein